MGRKSENINSEPADYFTVGGEMGERIAAFDWANSPLGPRSKWEESLTSTLSVCLSSRFPMAIYWSDEGFLLYNDAWRPILGDKHPWALGKPAHEVWSEIWDFIAPVFESVRASGEGSFRGDELLPMQRFGYTEECYFDYTFNPIRGKSGAFEGILNVVQETTYRVLNDRRTRLLRELAACSGSARSEEDALKMAISAMATDNADIPFALVYLVEPDDRRARLIAETGLPANSPARIEQVGLVSDAENNEEGWSFAEVFQKRKPAKIDDLAERFGAPMPGGFWSEPTTQAIALPITVAGQESVSAILVAGINPRHALDDEYQHFFELVAAHIATTLTNAAAYSAEKRRAEQLTELDRAKTEFFSNVSHEFRTPLTLMLGNLEEVLQKDFSIPEAEKEQIQAAHRNSLRLLKLVNNLLDFSRIEANRQQADFQATDLAELTAGLAGNFRSAVEKAGIKLTVDCPPLSRNIFVDREMWEKIVLNLISNAFKFTFEGEINIALRETESAVVLETGDTGTGIAAEELPHIFERFHRVSGAKSRTHEGTGIGLSLVRELVKMHGGEIGVKSEIGKGTTFTVSLPKDGRGDAQTRRRAEKINVGPFQNQNSLAFLNEVESLAAEKSIAPDGEPKPEIQSSKFKILLADDNADMRDYVRRLLVQNDYEVTTAADGESALENLEKNKVDLILSDVMMPRLDGFGLLQKIRENERTRGVPVILLSARAGEEAKIEGFEAGADDYLIKPFAARELLARVKANLKLSKIRRESEAVARRYRLLSEKAGDIIWMLRPDGQIIEVNQAAVEAYGYAREELLQMNIADLREPSTLPLFAGQMQQASEIGIIFETVHRRKDGSVFPVEVNSSGGDFGGERLIMSIVRDTSDRKRAEEALRESEEKFRTLADNISQLAWMTDNTGWIFWYNERWFEYTGTTSEEMRKRGWAAVLHLEESGRVIEKFKNHIASGEIWEDIFPIRSKTGEYRWFLSRALPIRDADGKIIRWFGTNTDIDEQRRLDLRNRFILDIDEAVRPLETPEEITLTLARLLGEYLGADRCAYAEVEADEDHFYIPGDYRKGDTHSIVGRYAMADFGQEVLRLMRANKPYVVHDVNTDAQITESDLAAYRLTSIEAVICVPLHKNGRFSACMAVHQQKPRRWLAEEVELVAFVANRFWESIERARIIKSLHESLAREQEARQQAESANRLKDEFLATVSHELRTPLNAILGWSTMARQQDYNAGITKRALEVIERNARNQNQIISDILDVSRIITGKLNLNLRPLKLSLVLQTAIDTVRPSLDAKRIRLETDFAAETELITGDLDRLQQVVWNLLANAVKFTPENGKIEVALRYQNSFAEMTVKDDGIGIEAEFLPFVFDRFRQADGKTNRKHGGLGLGLAVVRHLTELHGGSVKVQSDGVNSGATFVVRLPLKTISLPPNGDKSLNQNGEITSSVAENSAQTTKLLEGLKILVIDDEPDALEIVAFILNDQGANVFTANSVDRALEILDAEKLDLLISDIGMPEKDGFELMREIKTRSNGQSRSIPTLALTAYAGEEDNRRILAAGYQKFFPKPVEPAEFIKEIISLIQ